MMKARRADYLEKTVELPFEKRLSQQGLWPVKAERPTILQMNLGYLCNQQCAHCHYESGPSRTERMPDEVMEAALRFASRAGIAEFDLTGGAPELHPGFRWLVTRVRQQGGSITDRCNLTILSEPGNEGLSEFFAGHSVHVAASLPHYAEETTDRVRGQSAFQKSIAGLKMLNDAGYAQPGTGLRLTLAHSPAGAWIPGRQETLEADFRKHLLDGYGIAFTNLITITNMPIGRFLCFLERSGNLRGYMGKLERSFNAATLAGLMCRTTLSVGWDGTLCDCDFNQSLGISIQSEHESHIARATPDELVGRHIDAATTATAAPPVMEAVAGRGCKVRRQS